MSRKRIAILISGSGTNMAALLADMATADHPAEPVLVVSNIAGAGGLAKAKAAGVPTAVVPHQGREREEFEAALLVALNEVAPDIICLAGFMRILSPDFVSHYKGRMLNIHPSLLPLFPGLNTHARALDAGMAVHGATVHLVTPELDAGPICGQTVIPVLSGDTPETLAARLLPKENKLYPAVLRAFLSNEPKPICVM
ncbi:phosphoribosylglycinamide formyltransferase [Halovulum sp. GXIMD14793]